MQDESSSERKVKSVDKKKNIGFDGLNGCRMRQAAREK